METTRSRGSVRARPRLSLAIALAATSAALAPTTAAQDTGRALPGIYGLRRDGLDAINDKKVAEAIRRGLAWLEAHQDKEGLQAGRWGCKDFMRHDPPEDTCDGPGIEHDVGATGLALLAFLANGAGLRDGPDRDVVVRGLEWLTREQSKTTGVLGNPNSHDFIYDHAIATLALCEGYGMLGGDVRRQAAQKALDYLKRHRNPGGVWRYKAKDPKGDTSITTWCVHACVAGRDFGLDVDPDMDGRVLAWLDSVTDDPSGLIGYDQVGQSSSRITPEHRNRFPPHSGVLTASGTWARTLLGMHADANELLSKSLTRVEQIEPAWDIERGLVDYYYYYHGATALVANGRGKGWLESVRRILVENQRADGAAAGSWDAVGVWSSEGGRIMCTALALLTLQAPYRYAQRDAINSLPGGPPFDGLVEPWLAGRYAEAEAALKGLEDKGLGGHAGRLVAESRAAFDELVARAKKRTDELAKGPDYLTARRQLEAMRDRWRGLVPESGIEYVLGTFKKDKAIKRAIKASEELEKIIARYDPEKSSYQRKTMARKLKLLLKRYPGTHGALQADKLRREIE